MALVHAPESGRHLREFDHLAGGGVRPGRVVEAGGEPERASAHPVAHDRPHAVEFFGRGLARLHPEHRAADAAVPDELRHVESDAGVPDPRSLVREVDRATTIGVDEDGRDALREEGTRSPEFVPQERRHGVRMRVDEAGEDVSAGRVDHSVGGGRAEVAHGGDPAPIDRDIVGSGLSAGAIDEDAAADDEVVALRRGGPRHGHSSGEEGQGEEDVERPPGVAGRDRKKHVVSHAVESVGPDGNRTSKAHAGTLIGGTHAPVSSSALAPRPRRTPGRRRTPRRRPLDRRTRGRGLPRGRTRAREAGGARGPGVRGRARGHVHRPRGRRDHLAEDVSLPGARVPRAARHHPERDRRVREPRDPLPRLRGRRDPGGGGAAAPTCGRSRRSRTNSPGSASTW